MESKEDEIKDFEKRVSDEIKQFNEGVDTIIQTFEETLRKQVKTSSYRDYTEYFVSVMKHNEESADDEFIEPLSGEEWRKQKNNPT